MARKRGGSQWTKMSTCPLSTANMIAEWIKQVASGRSVLDAARISRSMVFTVRIAPRERRGSMSQNQFDDLPMIQCLPVAVPVGHPEHPDYDENEEIPDEPFYICFRGFDNVPGWSIDQGKA